MKKRTLILLSFLLIGAASSAWFYFREREKGEAVNLQTAVVQRGFIAKSVTATGSIQPVDTVIVGAQVSGVVKAVYTDYNDPVKKGQLLAKVDPSIIDAQIDEAQATLANAKSNLEYQQNNFSRQQQLFNLGAISKADYQIALNQFGGAKAGVSNAAAQVKLTERNLYYTNIYSPINGIVLNKNISAGQTIASSFSAPTLFVIAKDLSQLQVNADVDEADIGNVQPNQHVTFTVDAFPDDVFKGAVKEIYLHPSVSANVVTYPTLIDIDNREMKLKPGMTASITINVQEDSTALLIPTKALNYQPDSSLVKKYTLLKAYKSLYQKSGNNISSSQLSGKRSANKNDWKRYTVWVKNGDTLTERKILVGMNDGSSAQVVKGLAPGEDVVTGVAGGPVKSSSNEQRSPFLPQMQQPPSGGQRQRTL